MNPSAPAPAHRDAPGASYLTYHPSRYKWVILAVVFATLFTVVSAMGIATLFIGSWRSEFRWGVAPITLALSIQLILSGVSGIFAGALGDRFGPRPVFLAYLVVAAVGLLGVAAMKSLWQLYLFYGVFIGVGTTLHPITVPLVAKWFPKGRGIALGIIQQGDLLGLAALAPLMLALNQTIGWRVSWLTMGLVTLVVVMPLTWAFIRAPAAGPSGGATVQKTGIGAEGATLGEARRTRSFWGLVGSNFFCGFTARYFWLLVAPIAQEGGMNPAQVATTVTIAGLAALPGMLLFGAACERVGRARLLSINFAVRCVTFLVMALYLRTHQPALMFAAAGVAGFTTRSTAPPFSLALINCFGFRSLGALLGLTGTVHQAAAALSLFMAGYLFDRTGSYAPTLLVCSILLVVASFVAWRTPEKKCYSDASLPVQPQQDPKLIASHG